MTSFFELKELSGLTSNEIAERFGVSVRTIYRYEKDDYKVPCLAKQKLQEIVNATNLHRMSKRKEFTYIDLFAGIGGFRKAFDKVGGECVFTSEWDVNSRKTYLANYGGGHPVVGDIRDFTKDKESLDRIPRHDVLVAGFPCQPFSIAGVSKKNSLGRAHGFHCDTQGTLFFDLAQIIEHHQPKAFLLENVKNLTSHDGGNTFKIIKRTLKEELGYKIFPKVIDGRSWVPQHRERIFIVGFREDTDFDFDLLPIPPAEFGPRLGSILHNEADQDENPYVENGRAGEKYTLTPRLWEYLQEYRDKHAAKGNGFGFSLFGNHDVARTLSARYYKDGSEILIKQTDHERPRRLTPRECARLMGFDLPGESGFQIPVSDTQAYRQFGNSVVVPAATAIAELMKPHIMAAIHGDIHQLSLAFDTPVSVSA